MPSCHLFFLFILLYRCCSKIVFINSTSSAISKSSYFKQVCSTTDYQITLETDDDITYHAKYRSMTSMPQSYSFSKATPDYPTLTLPSILPSSGIFIIWEKMQINIHSNFDPKQIYSLNLIDLSSNKPTGEIIGVCFGPTSTNDIFALVRLTNIQIWIFSNSLTPTLKTIVPLLSSSDTIDKMICKGGKIFISTLRNLIVLSHDLSLNYLWDYSFSAVNSALDIDMDVNGNILSFSSGNTLLVYDHTTKTPSQLHSFSQGLNISSIKIIAPCYIIAEDSQQIFQYDYEIGQLIYTQSSSSISKKKVNLISNATIMFNDDLYISGINSFTSLYYYSVDQTYDCTKGCTSCFSGYDFDQINSLCIRSTPLPNITPYHIKPDSNCFIANQAGICQIFCDFKCYFCRDQRDSCVTCANTRMMNENGQCLSQPGVPLYTIAVNLGNTFRFGPTQGIYFFIENFEKYQYHKTSYTGIFRTFLDEIKRIDDLKWSFIPADTILGWTQTPSERYVAYNSFTNPRFLQVNQVASLFTSNTNIFYILFIPICFVIFLALKSLFRLLFRKKISQYFRMYSFWLYFFVIIFTNNSSDLCFLFLQYIRAVFSLSTELKCVHAISFILFGFFFAVFVALLSMSMYFYGWLSKYFLNNVFRTRWAFIYSFACYCIRPMIQSALHVLLYERADLQLLLLAVLQFIFILIGVILEVKYDIFKLKIMFFCEVALGTGMIILNFLLYFRYIYMLQEPENLEATERAIQVFTQSICYSIAVISIVSAALIPLLCNIIEGIQLVITIGHPVKKLKSPQNEGKINKVEIFQISRYDLKQKNYSNFNCQSNAKCDSMIFLESVKDTLRPNIVEKSSQGELKLRNNLKVEDANLALKKETEGELNETYFIEVKSYMTQRENNNI